MQSIPVARNPHEYAGSRAAVMLTDGLQAAKAEGRSLRSIAKELGYKQATVLSQMANGRVAVPIERAVQIARNVGISPSKFLEAAILQRVPEAVELLTARRGISEPDGLARQVALIAGVELDQLNSEQKGVIREVAAEANPRRRWMSVNELAAILEIRTVCPEVENNGLSLNQLEAITRALRDEKDPR